MQATDGRPPSADCRLFVVRQIFVHDHWLIRSLTPRFRFPYVLETSTATSLNPHSFLLALLFWVVTKGDSKVTTRFLLYVCVRERARESVRERERAHERARKSEREHKRARENERARERARERKFMTKHGVRHPLQPRHLHY
jgi:cell shape-determining protein MreC